MTYFILGVRCTSSDKKTHMSQNTLTCTFQVLQNEILKGCSLRAFLASNAVTVIAYLEILL